MALPGTPSVSLDIRDNILGTIGRTPLVRLNRVGRGLACTLPPKLSFSTRAARSKTASR